MDKLTEGDDDFDSLNDVDVSIKGLDVSKKQGNVSINGTNVSINHDNVSIDETKGPISEDDDPVVIRKKQIMKILKSDSRTTVEQLQSELSVTVRTIYRGIEWLKENGYLERLGSNRVGSWHVIKELE